MSGSRQIDRKGGFRCSFGICLFVCVCAWEVPTPVRFGSDARASGRGQHHNSTDDYKITRPNGQDAMVDWQRPAGNERPTLTCVDPRANSRD